MGSFHVDSNFEKVQRGDNDCGMSIEKILGVVKDLNMSMDQVAFWCVKEASFANSAGGENFIRDDEETEKHLCANYTQGIVMWFETKKRKRDTADDSEKKNDD